MMPLSRLGCPLSLKTPNMGNPGYRGTGGPVPSAARLDRVPKQYVPQRRKREFGCLERLPIRYLRFHEPAIPDLEIDRLLPPVGRGHDTIFPLHVIQALGAASEDEAIVEPESAPLGSEADFHVRRPTLAGRSSDSTYALPGSDCGVEAPPQGIADESQHVQHVALAGCVRPYEHRKGTKLQVEFSDTLEVASPDPRDGKPQPVLVHWSRHC